MKEIIYNYNNLLVQDIDEIVTRVKGLLINDKNEIILGYSNVKYQFPGGHLEADESLENCLKREIREETGIVLTNEKPILFLKITHYSKNYHNSGLNRENVIYYYLVRTNKKVDLDNTNYDEEEKRLNFHTEIIKLKNIEKVLNKNLKKHPQNNVLVEEMKEALKEYYKIFG